MIIKLPDGRLLDDVSMRIVTAEEVDRNIAMYQQVITELQILKSQISSPVITEVKK